MNQQTVIINEKSSKKVDPFNIIVSVRTAYGSHAEVVVGSPGLPNVVKDLLVGDIILFETPNDGIIEVRALSVDSVKMELLVSQVSPRLGIVGGFIDEDPNNAPFTPLEVSKIASSIVQIKSEIGYRNDVTSEQLELLGRKLDEIQKASERLGRKDWINYVAGTLTTLCVSAAFAPEVTKAIFQAANSAFSWLFENALRLLS